MIKRILFSLSLFVSITAGAFSSNFFPTSLPIIQSQSKAKQSINKGKQSIDIAQFQPIADSIHSFMDRIDVAEISDKIAIEQVLIYPKKQIDIHFTRTLSEYPLRDDIVSTIYDIAAKLMPVDFSQYSLKLYSSKIMLEDLSSSYFSLRRPNWTGKSPDREANWVSNTSLPYEITRGLQDRHIALWQSHGYYYEKKESRWEWQRARYFQTVEDLFTQSYVLPYLVPMLENAGAYVMLPRERDFNTNEIIVDNSSPYYTEHNASSTSESIALSEEMWSIAEGNGFANPKSEYHYGDNPFEMGSSREIGQVKASLKDGSVSVASWCPDFSQAGRYAVYVSYKSSPMSTSGAEYVVRHAGGESTFNVNQKIGGSTWVYLGTFNFGSSFAKTNGNIGRTNSSSNSSSSSSKNSSSVLASAQGVYLYNSNPDGHKYEKGAVVSADAVKFGGGMGNIARGNDQSAQLESTSGYPRYAEGARYWLQWAGFPSSVYSPEDNKDDYRDDYQSRGLWVNHLLNNMNVPVDLSLAFHSDAGVTPTDSIIGTLAIFTTTSEGKDIFTSGSKRLASREMADMIQSQIVNDIRATYEPNWSRRGLWDRSYFESRVPEVPAMLLELLAHQNFADMRYGQDPNFRFTVCRAVYKGMLRFLSEYYDFKYVIQPLPVKDFSATLVEVSGNPSVKLSWSPTEDPLEATATTRNYVVYTRAIPIEAFTLTPNTDSTQNATSSHIDAVSTLSSSIINGNVSMSASQVAAGYGFDGGIFVSKGTSLTLPVKPGYIYSYKVVPINEGGAGFPSQILSVGLCQDWKDKYTALIINGFDRISAPESYATSDTLIAGFADNMDSGVGYLYNYGYTGSQFEFRRGLDWADDDAPGFGASNANYERAIVAGNSFDYPLTHGVAFLNSGYNFVSSSASAISTNSAHSAISTQSKASNQNNSSTLSLSSYPIVDLILGKQRTTTIGRPGATEPRYEAFPIELQSAISKYCYNGGKIIVSGSYIASDIWQPTSLPTANFNSAVPSSDTQDQEMEAAKANIESLNSLLESMQSDIYRKVSQAKRLNDSLGFEYYKIDPKAIENLRNTVATIQRNIDSLSAEVTQSSADIKAIEKGTDASERSKAFASEILKYKYLTGHASVSGQVYPIGILSNNLASLPEFTYYNRPNPYCYSVESPDAITPTDPNAKIILRYAENNIPAGVAYTGEDYSSVALGFPIESLTTQDQINRLISALIDILIQ